MQQEWLSIWELISYFPNTLMALGIVGGIWLMLWMRSYTELGIDDVGNESEFYDRDLWDDEA